MRFYSASVAADVVFEVDFELASIDEFACVVA